MLQHQFSSTSRAKLIDLKRQLQTVTKGSSSCVDLLQRVRRISDELAFIGGLISDDDLVLTVLNGLGPEFNSFVAAVTATSRHDSLSFSDLQGMLFSHESLLKSQNLPTTNSLPSAFVTFSNNGVPRHPHPNSRQRPNQVAPQQTMRLNFRPNNSGILPRPPAQNKLNTPLNTQPRPPTGTTQTQFSQSETNPVQKLQCQICKKTNHTAKNCRFRYTPNPAYQPRSNYQAYVAQPSNINNSADWILDSGASHHVTNDVNNLTAFFNYGGADSLQIGDGSGLPIDHIGTSSLLISDRIVLLKDTLHVSNFSRNIISLSKLLVDNPSLMVIFSNSACSLKDTHTNQTILEFTCIHGLYYLHASSPSTVPPKAFVGVRTDAISWHRRLAIQLSLPLCRL